MFSGNWSIWNHLKKWYDKGSYLMARKLIVEDKQSDELINKNHSNQLSSNTLAIMRLIFKIEELEQKMIQIKLLLAERNSLLRRGNEKNHRGIFRVTDDEGTYIKYNKGDIVEHKNKTYIANKNIEEGMGPLHSSAGWKEITPSIVEGGEF
tara:strand:+ start:29 stop:481 length:453 start_codon:yes stop_codon:yes gene_type:complete